jgi:hypothetical protein
MRKVRKVERAYNRVIDKYGKYIVYIRRDARIKCSCWNDNTQEADLRHELCFGTGRKIYIEKQLAILEVVDTTLDQLFQARPEPIGIMAYTGYVAFLKRNAWPSMLDKLYEVEWDVNKDRVINMGRVSRLADAYTVQQVTRVRCQDGEIIAHRCATHTEDVEYHWIEDLLRKADFTWNPANIDGVLYEVPI